MENAPARFRIQTTEFDSNGAWPDRASHAALFCMLLVILLTFADYGMSWDEPHSIAYGRRVLSFFASFGAERSALEGEVALRSGHFHALVEWIARAAPHHVLLVRRLITPLVGWLGLAGCWRLARRLAGPFAGFVGVVLLALTPLYYGHMFINPADVPFAAAYVWALYYGVLFIDGLPKPKRSVLLLAGVASGFAMGIRIIGVLSLVYVCLLYIAAVAAARSGAAAARTARPASLRALLALFAISYVVMLALWPAALLQPLAQPFAALLEAVAFPKHEPVLFGGRSLWSDALPRGYQLGYLVVQLPEFIMPSFVLGAIVTGRALSAAVKAGTPDKASAEAATLLAIFVPLACAGALRPVDYDAGRHWLFVLPPIACVAACGLSWLFAQLTSRPRLGVALAALLVLCLGRELGALAELHPYEYTYYNAFVGGTRGASGRYELDYWITSFREAVIKLTSQLAVERFDHAGQEGKRYRLFVCGHVIVAAAYLPPWIELAPDEEHADYVLATTKWSCDARYRGQVVAEVSRDGAVFSVVKRLARADTHVAVSAR